MNKPKIRIYHRPIVIGMYHKPLYWYYNMIGELRKKGHCGRGGFIQILIR